MEKPQKAIVTDEGHLYLLKRPLYQQGLFWTSLFLGLLTLGLLLLTVGDFTKTERIHQALERYNMYYDADDEDIYSYAEEWEYDLTPIQERLTDTTLTVLDQLFDDPNQVVLTSLEPALNDIKQAAKVYVSELEGLSGELIASDLLSDEEITEIEESLETYRGYVNMSTEMILNLYQMKEEENRGLTQEEIELMQVALSNLLDDVSVDWELSTEVPDSKSV